MLNKIKQNAKISNFVEKTKNKVNGFFSKISNVVRPNFKKVVDKFDRRLDRLMEKLPFTIYSKVPNILTTIRLIGALGLSVAVAFTGIASPILLGSLATLVVSTDFLDGHIARRYHLESKFGSFLDAAVDKVFCWGIALGLFSSGALTPVAALGLLPIAARDVVVAGVTAKDKYDDGKEKERVEKRTKSSFEVHKKMNRKTTLKRKMKRLIEGDSMPPTKAGKLKMWGMSIALVGTLFFGLSTLPASIPFIAGTTLSYLCIAKDIPQVLKNAKLRKENREDTYQTYIKDIERIVREIQAEKKKKMQEDRNKQGIKDKTEKQYNPTLEQEQAVNQQLLAMEQDSSYHDENSDTIEKPVVLVKKGNN